MGAPPQGALQPGGMQPPGALPAPAPAPSPQVPIPGTPEPTANPTSPMPPNGAIQRSPLGALLLPQGQPLMQMMQRVPNG